MLNRSIPPRTKKIKSINFSFPEKYQFQNGINTFVFNSEISPVIKLDIIFKSGFENATKKLLPSFSNFMLKEASQGMNANETAEFFDYYGAFIQNFVTNNTSGLRLFVPKKYFFNVLPTFANLIQTPAFPEEEFLILKEKNKESIKLNLTKTRYTAMKGINNQLFGDFHPRGWLLSPDDSDLINLNEIKEYSFTNFSSKNCSIHVSGSVDNGTIKQIEEYFSKNFGDTKIKKNKNENKFSTKDTSKYYQIPNAVQSSIYMAKNLGKLSDEEIIDIGILNTILGGYFGSRLMKNIREEKGYTYGINSFLTDYDNCTVLKITSDLASKYVDPTIKEIFNELEKLATKPISNSELNTIKNYISGEILSSIDGVFQHSAIWEKLISSNRNENFINQQFERLKNISAAEIKQIANKIFNKSDFYTAIAGNSK